MTGLSSIDRTIQHTLEWVDDVCAEMNDPDRAHGWVALRAVLKELRDLLGMDEAADLAAQLPMLLRGLYFEGWDPQPERVVRDRETFLFDVQTALGSDRVDAADAARAVFAVIGRRLGGEAQQARNRLAAPVRELWPSPS